MTPPHIEITPEQRNEFGRHDFCILSLDEYHEADGTVTVCLECSSCKKVLACFKIGTPSID